MASSCPASLLSRLTLSTAVAPTMFPCPQGLVDPVEHRRRGGRRGRGTALGDEDASEAEGERFFESFRPREKKGTFSEEQVGSRRGANRLLTFLSGPGLTARMLLLRQHKQSPQRPLSALPIHTTLA